MSDGIIAAGHEQTAHAAALILKDGGNAFDAAIAAFFTSFISEPCMSSPGGGAFANILTATGQSVFLDCFCQTPQKKRPISEIDFGPMVVNFGSTTETFHVGMGSIAVPGIIAGIYYIHEHFATRPMSVLVQPALDIARNGVVMNNFQFFDIRVLKAIITKEAEARQIFYPKGEPLPVGSILRMPAMADYLEFLIKEGKREFYEGEFAKQLVLDSQNKGGFLTMGDMQNYTVNVTKPLSFSYRDRTILTNPLPSIGGTLLGLVLRKLEKQFQNNYQPFSPQHVQTLQQIIDEVFRIERTVTNLDKKWGSTSHFNIVDKKGNAINITMSNGEGCGYMVPGTNIMMNNMLGEAALLPNGFHSWTPNTRLSSMMSPTIVLDAQKNFEIATGTGGASRIPAAIAQVLHYLIDFKMDLHEAVHAARLHNEHLELNLEPDFVGKHRSQELLKVVNWEEPAMFFGGVHTIQRKGKKLYAAADNRREGFALEV
ncbi:gamma-glutamyltransferase [Aureispira anguillae]|uniref:Gamma-glutamyltransferase n=1 Tax=Aureispira anguillae TaxID=2864201 RepID=A0A915YJD1_9BACT|nr:gamma-glutamyltransferase [Aureispira anguillae]BDS14285.1 gamma-glutamyltransferase [Aureispira anguillae]